MVNINYKEIFVKNQKFFIALVLLVAFSLMFNFLACSKSSKSDGGSSGSKGESISGFAGSGGSETIKLKIIGMPGQLESISVHFFEKEKYGSEEEATWVQGKIVNGSVELDLHDPYDEDVPWTKAGDYYIEFRYQPFKYGMIYRYTDGKTLKDLGFNNVKDAKDSQDKRFPTYSLKGGENTLDWGKQVLRIGNDTTLDGSEGIKIALTGSGGGGYDVTYTFYLYDELESYSGRYERAVSGRRGPVAKGSSSESNDLGDFINIYLYELKNFDEDKTKPFTKPGTYYLGVKLGKEHERDYYTGGKTFQELGINASSWVLDSEYRKFPQYKLELTGNTLDMNQIKSIRGDQGYN